MEYASHGLLGVLTPQANTTVEPELAILMPPGHALINARLMSPEKTIEDRLRDYFRNFEDATAQFANAPLTAIAFACTGTSYLAGLAAEDALINQIRAVRGIEVITAATAVLDALAVLGATRIGLVSPYDTELDEASAGYWSGRGLRIIRRVSAFAASDAFHPIYSLGSDAAQRGIDSIAGEGLEAIVMLGTGMPTLAPIARTPIVAGAALLSCMFCLAWRASCAMSGTPISRDSLLSWLHEPRWRARLAGLG